jgi:hypothetical protein
MILAKSHQLSSLFSKANYLGFISSPVLMLHQDCLPDCLGRVKKCRNWNTVNF